MPSSPIPDRFAPSASTSATLAAERAGALTSAIKKTDEFKALTRLTMPQARALLKHIATLRYPSPTARRLSPVPWAQMQDLNGSGGCRVRATLIARALGLGAESLTQFPSSLSGPQLRKLLDAPAVCVGLLEVMGPLRATCDYVLGAARVEGDEIAWDSHTLPLLNIGGEPYVVETPTGFEPEPAAPALARYLGRRGAPPFVNAEEFSRLWTADLAHKKPYATVKPAIDETDFSQRQGQEKLRDGDMTWRQGLNELDAYKDQMIDAFDAWGHKLPKDRVHEVRVVLR